jgi:Fic/DOC family
MMNHPFIDGNKRVGHAALETFLVLNGQELSCPVVEQERRIFDLAAGRLKRENFTAWVQTHMVPLGGGLRVRQDANDLQATEAVAPRADCPEIIRAARVICYTPLDSRHRHSRKTRQIVGGALQGPAAGLAICHDEEGGYHHYFLFGCNEAWEPLTDTWHQTVEEAKSQAEFEYEGVSATWCYK